jgi:hypothetical protein
MDYVFIFSGLVEKVSQSGRESFSGLVEKVEDNVDVESEVEVLKYQ